MRAGLSRAVAVCGDRDAALAIARELEPLGRFDYELALVHAALADREAVRAALGRARVARSGWMPYARHDVRLAAIDGARSPLPAIDP